MEQIRARAWAKINLSLDVLGRLPGGYHEMKMIMQSTTLCDDVTITLNDAGKFSSSSSLDFLPRDERNIALAAAKLFLAETGREGMGATVEIKKRIPVGAGLGGGSADAAAVLRALNRHFSAGLSRRELEELGGRLGSDVPFCVGGGTQLATGRGDVLEPLKAMPDCAIVICKPRFPIQTPYLFSRIDRRRSRLHPDTAGMLEAIERGDLTGVARRCHNVFEDVLPPGCGEIGVIKGRLLDCGALGAVMSGTGSAVFGLFPTVAAADDARDQLKKDYAECFSVRPEGEHI